MIFLYYIEECDKLNRIFRMFSIIQLDDNKLKLPVGKEKMSDKQAEKLAKKTKTILEKVNTKKVILSKEIKKQEQYVNDLYAYGIKITEGKWLYEILAYDILEYILKKQNKKKEETQISIAINDVSEIMLEHIKKMVKEYKMVHIVTNHIDKFKKIEEQVWEEDGIMLTLSSNRRKALVKSQIILNVDFPSELLNTYWIYDEAIIVNLKNKVTIQKKRFNGICIHDYEITYQTVDSFLDDFDLQDKYDKKDIYESQIYKRQPVEKILEKLKHDKVRVVKLVGMNSDL